MDRTLHRLTADVILIQDRSVPGGNTSSERHMHLVGTAQHDKAPRAREGGIIEELWLEDGVWNCQRSPHLHPTAKIKRRFLHTCKTIHATRPSWRTVVQWTSND